MKNAFELIVDCVKDSSLITKRLRAFETYFVIEELRCHLDVDRAVLRLRRNA